MIAVSRSGRLMTNMTSQSYSAGLGKMAGRRTTLILWVFGSLLSACGGCGPAACLEGIDMLSIQVVPHKQKFLKGEPIWIRATLSNPGPDTVAIPNSPLCLICRDFVFVLSRDEERVPYRGLVASYKRSPMLIAPGEQFSETFDLLASFGRSVQGTHGLDRASECGDYTLTAENWGVSSSAVTFKVVEPNDNELVIYQAIQEALLMNGQGQTKNAVERLDLVMQTLEGSSYKDRVYYILANMTRVTDRERHLEICRTMLETMPDSYYSRFYVRSVMEGMTSQDADKLVQDLESRSVGSRAAVEARKALSAPWLQE